MPPPAPPSKRSLLLARASSCAAALLCLALYLAPTRASACATCGCGDPTLTLMGAGQPFSGRLRLGAELRYRWDELGGPDTE